MKLLMITRKVDKDDGLAGFSYNWIKKLASKVDFLYVMCLEKGNVSGLPDNVEVYSLGKENGKNRFKEFINFQKLAIKLLPKVDGVFSHQNPEYGILISPWTKIFRKKLIAWYAHGSVSLRLKWLNLLSDKMVTSTSSGFKLKSDKLVILHQGIDQKIFYFKERKNHEEIRLLSVSRISETKNIDLMIDLVGSLKSVQAKPVFLKIVGLASSNKEKDYLLSLQNKALSLGLQDNIEFLGSIANDKTPEFYHWADVFLNFSQTQSLDKTILEAMSCGTLIFTSNESAVKIIEKIEPRMIADNFDNLSNKILSLLEKDANVLREKLSYEVKEKHDLNGLVEKIVQLFK